MISPGNPCETEAASQPRTVTVDPDAVDEIARRLDWLAKNLEALHCRLVEQEVGGMSAIPPSDLQNAFGYCWGRWSQVILDALEQLTVAATSARVAATEWRATEAAVARQARVVPPAPGTGP